jgi:hypothetical protein
MNFMENYDSNTFKTGFNWWPDFSAGYKEPFTVLPVVVMAFAF